MLPQLRVGLAVACLMALGVAGCGSSSSSSSTSSGSASSAGSSTASSAAGGAAPIKIGALASISSSVFQIPEYQSGLQAAVDALNASGGIDGHKLALTQVCNTGYTDNGEIACARTLAGSGIAAAVGPETDIDQSGAVWKVFQAAKIPVVGSGGGSAAELNNPDVYPYSSGIFGAFLGNGQALVSAGAKNIAILLDNNPTGPVAAQFITKALGAQGIHGIKTVSGDPSTDPTFATAAGKASAGGVDGIVAIGAPVNVARMIQALRSGGYKGKISTPTALLPQPVIKTLGAAANGVIVDNVDAYLTSPGNSGVKQFKADMAKYAPGAAVDINSEQAWGAVELFAQGAGHATSFSAGGLSTAFKTLKSTINVGVVGPWSPGYAGKVPGLPRILNPYVAFAVIKNGETVAEKSGFVNVFTK